MYSIGSVSLTARFESLGGLTVSRCGVVRLDDLAVDGTLSLHVVTFGTRAYFKHFLVGGLIFIIELIY